MAEKKLTKRDLLKVWLLWNTFLHGMYNWERMQGMGVTHAMIPVINRLYDTKEDIAQALQRHLIFFNTNTTTGTIAAGVMAAMEEQRANGKPVTDEMINNIKVAMMGPLAGLGDSIFQGMLFPILLAIGIGLGLEGNVMGPIIYTVLVLGISYPLHYAWFMAAYKKGAPIFQDISGGNIVQRATAAASFVGLMAAGALSGRFVNFGIVKPVEIGEFVQINLQTDVLDVIFPRLLPLLLVLGIWIGLRKGWKPNRVVLGLFAAGLILGYFGIIGR